MCQGSEAYTFTDGNSRGTGFTTGLKGAAPLTVTLNVVDVPEWSCDRTMVDHWPTGGGGVTSAWKFGLSLIAVVTISPESGW